MQQYQSALTNWLKSIFKTQNEYTLFPIVGDASFRSYYRLYVGEQAYILMNSPPGLENTEAFLQIGRRLHEHGILTPNIFHADVKQGFVLLEDFGNELLLNHLNHESARDHYTRVMDILLKLQRCHHEGLSSFDTDYMMSELLLFLDWFVKIHLDIKLSADEQRFVKDFFYDLATEINTYPKVFIHRDFHSRNLMLFNKEIGVIDFQDAMLGPLPYDLVSLLRDCYIYFPRDTILPWVRYFYDKLPKTYNWSFEQFLHGFDTCGLQRHIKIHGIFTRLYWRDNKSGYLKDLPRVFQHMIDELRTKPQYQDFYQFIRNRIVQPFLKRSDYERCNDFSCW